MAEPTHESREIEIDNMCTIEEKREDLANLIPVSKEQKKCTDVEDQTRNALSVIAELTDVIQVLLIAILFKLPSDTYARRYQWQGDSLLLDPPNSDGDTIDWVECGHCSVWIHTLCDYVEDKTNYVCCMCRA
ncbi:hypothetical protein OS493_038560 [Desmophyllum pertusum]|uniref:Uncharacterized protein n=1 Tax=Desmophyllum pertusum TaxID=174260 RepID=A0A9W9ZHJ7_9CNID|nr:hypothetical protein OS493_038560 [Desmophyllum pertusum]